MPKRKGKKRTTHYKKQLGQAPGTLIYTGEKEKTKLFIESFDYTPDQVIEKELATVEDVFKYKQTDSISWINLNGLNHITEIEKLGDHYNLHPLVLEDIVNTSQRPKIDDYNDYIFLVAQMMYYDADEQIVNEQIILRGCKMFKEPCHKIGRMRDIEIDKKGRIYIITDELESSLWRISK